MSVTGFQIGVDKGALLANQTRVSVMAQINLKPIDSVLYPIDGFKPNVFFDWLGILGGFS